MRENGAGSPVLFFLADLGTLEPRGLRSSVAGIQILLFADLRVRWRAGVRTRVFLHAGAQGAVLEHGCLTSRILVFLPLDP